MKEKKIYNSLDVNWYITQIRYNHVKNEKSEENLLHCVQGISSWIGVIAWPSKDLVWPETMSKNFMFNETGWDLRKYIYWKKTFTLCRTKTKRHKHWKENRTRQSRWGWNINIIRLLNWCIKDSFWSEDCKLK